uniref:Uncharacterized protein n=1 Tax=Picea sitchensis TaxID=3332 RepID=A9NJV2_PICSI|nr:unknown [Picea sitchensis]
MNFNLVAHSPAKYCIDYYSWKEMAGKIITYCSPNA